MESAIKVSNMDFKRHSGKCSFPSTNMGGSILYPCLHHTAQPNKSTRDPEGSHPHPMPWSSPSSYPFPHGFLFITGRGLDLGASLSRQTAGAVNPAGGGLLWALCI